MNTFPKMLLFGSLFFCGAISIAQAPLPPLDAGHLASIDDFVKHEMASQRIPGLELGIYSRGRILLAKGYGLANVELNVPVKPETVMQSGSVGKQFVSAAIMTLVEDGKISLNDSITKYFSDAPASWKPILIKNLLSHTSGLSEYESGDRTGPNGPFYLRLDFTEDELAKKVEALPIEWAPGEKWDYRNTNYLLLGIIIHKVTGMPYAEFLSERIFKPLGMISTRLISERDIIPNRASGYELDRNGELKNQEWVSPTFNSTADGALYFNVLDLDKWDEALYGTKLLKQSSLDRIWTVYPLNDGKPNSAGYGFGWMIGAQDGHKRIEHGGAWQGFTCRISRYPDDSLTVVVLTNLGAGPSNPGVIAHVVAGLVNPALTVPKLEPIADDQPELAERLKKLLDEVAAGADVRAETTSQVAAAIAADTSKRFQHSLANLWPGGTLTLVKRDKRTEGQPQWVSTYRLSKGGDAMLIQFGVGADGKVSVLSPMRNREYQW
ncbi:MAG TPA: serine hydrolase domain-containing protein [Verrucomicrobiae bacterium]|jgi:CubicO group peptidase (beta-lactamase class C family)|nr:serine hydrolase domain-containing protein [Verrucomicrobiae bacterium]